MEFKSSFKFDLATQSGNKELPKVVAKTLCGFLNASGGNLLVGVADNGDVLGLESDLTLISSRNTDGLERAIRMALANHLGVEVSPHVNVAFVDLDGAIIAHITCTKHHQPVYLRDGDKQMFYVRDGNQTKPLDIANAHRYISGHWPAVGGVDDERLRAIVSEAVASVQRPRCHCHRRVRSHIEEVWSPWILRHLGFVWRPIASSNCFLSL